MKDPSTENECLNEDNGYYCLCDGECIKCYDELSEVKITIHVNTSGFIDNSRCQSLPYSAIEISKLKISIK